MALPFSLYPDSLYRIPLYLYTLCPYIFIPYSQFEILDDFIPTIQQDVIVFVGTPLPYFPIPLHLLACIRILPEKPE
jgi:hypothetical protein